MKKTLKSRILPAAALAFAVAGIAGCMHPDEEQMQADLDAKIAARRAEWLEERKGKPQPPQRDVDSDLVVLGQLPRRSGAEEVNPYPIYSANSSAAAQAPESGKTEEDEKKLKVVLNFQAAPLEEVIPIFAELLEFQYLTDAALPFPVTMAVNAELSRHELDDIFNQVLSAAGTYAVREGAILRIRAMETAPQNRIGSNGGALELGIFPLRNTTAKDAEPQIAQFTSKGVKVIISENRNTLLLVDTPDAVKRVREILNVLDAPQRLAWHKMILPCRNVPADRIARELSQIIPVLGFPVLLNNDKIQPDAIQINSLDRLQIIVAAAASREALEEVGRWTAILDHADAGDPERVFIYNIMNGKADELLSALSVMFPVESRTLSSSSAGSSGGNGKSDSSSASGASTSGASANSSTNAATAARTGNSEPAGSVFDVPVKVFADAVHNRLVIRTTPRAYGMIRALLERLDTIPAQVLLQILVIEVSLNDTVKFGVEFMMSGGSGNVGTLGGLNYKGLVPDDKGQYGGQFWIFNPEDPTQKYGFVNALAGQTDVKVISSPQVLVISHNQAEISVGDKVPIVNSEITNTQSAVVTDKNASTNLVRNIQYQDTGIMLKITPHVTRGNRISIDLDQTVSEAVSNKTSSIDSPEIQERKLKTSMTIKDGQTIICGGIIREKITDNLDTLPILGQIPYLRRLIGDTNISKQRTEMLVLISGQIITGQTPLDELVQRYRSAVNGLIDFDERNRKEAPFNKQPGQVDTWFF